MTQRSVLAYCLFIKHRLQLVHVHICHYDNVLSIFLENIDFCNILTIVSQAKYHDILPYQHFIPPLFIKWLMTQDQPHE